MTDQLSRGHMRRRHVFRGTLVMDTALHIGGGREQISASDSPIIRDPLGRPYIPGSSFKGAFRAAVERLVPNLAHLGLHTCALQPGYAACMSTNKSLDEAYGVLTGLMGRALRDSEAITQALETLQLQEVAGQTVTDALLLKALDRWLCATCKVFGSPRLAALTQFADLPVQEPWLDIVQVRDGVGIDRDSERARERIKYDYEVVPPGTGFGFFLTVENAAPRDLGLVAIGLQELVNGMVTLGGIRSRGLGRCHLEDLQVQMVDFENTAALTSYLTQGPPALQDAAPLLNQAIQQLLNPEAQNAQTTG